MDASASGGVLTSRLTAAIDPNHEDGFGALQLVGYVYLLDQVDLRDAQISFDVQGEGFVPHDADFYLWAQACRYGEKYGPRGVRCANWAFSSQPLTTQLTSGQKQRVNLVLENDERKWSYGGNNAEQKTHAVRYDFLPLDTTLSAPINLHWVLAKPPEGTPAEGTVRISNVEICSNPKPKGPALVSVERSGSGLTARVNARGEPTVIVVSQAGETIATRTAGQMHFERDVYFRDINLDPCSDIKVEAIAGSLQSEMTLESGPSQFLQCHFPGLASRKTD